MTVKRALRDAAIVLGVALVAGAAYVAGTRIDTWQLHDAWPALIGVIFVCVLLNLALTSALFWIVTLSFDASPRVTLWRMTQLICASAMLNYLPLRPGLVGRAAYLKLRHALPIHQSMMIMLLVLILGLLVLGTAAALVLYMPDSMQMYVAAVLLLAASLLTPALMRLLVRWRIVAGWSWVPVRLADLLVGSLRLWLAFMLVDQPITFAQAIVLGAAGMLVSLVGITPNGLGLREWVIGALSAALAITSAPAGLAATLIDRGAELLVVLVTGLWSMRAMGREQASLRESR